MPDSPEPPHTPLLTACRGVLMGAADIVPGVSGGTVALILGIYTRLVTAISHVDGRLLQLVRHGQWGKITQHLDLRFLVALATGIAVGIVALAGVMHTLMEEHREPTYAAFFGMILASGVLVGRMCRPRGSQQKAACLAIAVVAAAGAWWVVSQVGLQNRPGNHAYTFVCGAVGICAMILPGVSGSYLLLILDKYEEITGIIKALPKMQVNSADLLTVCVFASGCIIGLLLFSKLLRWLLTTYQAETMAALCGFMIGSLWKVWPFQQGDTPPDASLKEQAVLLSPGWPDPTQPAVLCLVVGVVSFVAVLAIDQLAARFSTRGADIAEG